MAEKILKCSISLYGKQYPYILKSIDKKTIHLECRAAALSQQFSTEDIAGILMDLPEFILEEKEHKENKSSVVRFRATPEEKKKIEKIALEKGYLSVSSYLIDLALKN